MKRQPKIGDVVVAKVGEHDPSSGYKKGDIFTVVRSNQDVYAYDLNTHRIELSWVSEYVEDFELASDMGRLLYRK